jgi:hypothetical protein
MAEPLDNKKSSDNVSLQNEKSNLSILGHFFTDSTKVNSEWSMRCKLCSCKIKSRVAVTSNFHRHLRVSKTISSQCLLPYLRLK